MDEATGGRAYFHHLLVEHGRLNKRLLEIGHEVGDLCQDGRTQDSLAHLARQLTDLRQELQAHFAEEEAGGCLEEAVTRCPSLGIESKAILAEHPRLDRMLEKLLGQTQNLLASPAEIRRDYQAFAEQLRAHDAAENRLLQMAFGAETADYDVEGGN